MGVEHRDPGQPWSRSGLSFVELLVAITILTFALMPLLSFMRTGSRGVQGTRDIASAAYLAGQALESLRAWRFEELCEEDPPGPSGLPPAEAVFKQDEYRDLTVGRIRFEREVELVPLSGGAGSGSGPATGPELKLATVRVRWKRDQMPLYYEVTTVISSAP